MRRKLYGFSAVMLGSLALVNPSFAIENEATVEVKSDGTKIIKKNDGASIEIKADGTKFVRDVDGSTILINPDGSKTIKTPNGAIINVTPKHQ